MRGRPIIEAFAFFADARNLETITPPWAQFEVKSKGPVAMRQGALIEYRLCLLGFPLTWRSKIEAQSIGCGLSPRSRKLHSYH
jgi:ligand-binding SRPBCC domain-containing protein